MNEQEEKELLKQAMSLLGKRTSEKKATTARENGKKGGRPRKQPTNDELLEQGDSN